MSRYIFSRGAGQQKRFSRQLKQQKVSRIVQVKAKKNDNDRNNSRLLSVFELIR